MLRNHQHTQQQRVYWIFDEYDAIGMILFFYIGHGMAVELCAMVASKRCQNFWW
jgi:uncharacterized membrane protein YeiH